LYHKIEEPEKTTSVL